MNFSKVSSMTGVFFYKISLSNSEIEAGIKLSIWTHIVANLRLLWFIYSHIYLSVFNQLFTLAGFFWKDWRVLG